MVHVRTGSAQLYSSRVVPAKENLGDIAEPNEGLRRAATPLQLVVGM